MKHILRIGLVTVLALLLTGCGTSAIIGTSDNGSKPAPLGITVNDVNYEVLNTVPKGIVTSNSRGYKVVKQDKEYVVIIQAGEKPNSGYGVEVQSIKDTGGKTEIIVEETEPKPGEMNATVITSPRVIVKIGNNIAPEFVVSNSKGDEFKNID